jgi:hypothetical protein
MALSTTLVPLAVAFVGLCGALGGVIFTQIRADRRAKLERDREDARLSAEREREDVRWSRERDREKAAWAREDAARSEERTQQRLADSYLEVLHIVEREGQWIADSIRKWKIAAKPDEFVVDLDRVMMPRPAITDQAVINAHLAACGSDNVRRLYKVWRDVTDQIGDQLTELTAIDDWLDDIQRKENPGVPRSGSFVHDADDQFVQLKALHPDERAARLALADAIAGELGHR